MGVGLFYELDLPVALPVLQLFLALYRRAYFNNMFVPNQIMQLMPGGETRHSICFVLVNASDQVIGNADVQGAISPIGHHVHERHSETSTLLDPGVRRGDVVWVGHFKNTRSEHF